MYYIIKYIFKKNNNNNKNIFILQYMYIYDVK